LLALLGGHAAHLVERPPHLFLLATVQLAPLLKDRPCILALSRTKLRENLLTLAELLPSLRREPIPPSQVLADLPLFPHRQMMEAIIVRHNPFLLIGRQIPQPLEKAWPVSVAPMRILVSRVLSVPGRPVLPSQRQRGNQGERGHQHTENTCVRAKCCTVRP